MSIMLFASLLDQYFRKSCSELNCHFATAAVREDTLLPLHAAAPEKTRNSITPQSTELSVKDLQCNSEVHLQSRPGANSF